MRIRTYIDLALLNGGNLVTWNFPDRLLENYFGIVRGAGVEQGRPQEVPVSSENVTLQI